MPSWRFRCEDPIRLRLVTSALSMDPLVASVEVDQDDEGWEVHVRFRGEPGVSNTVLADLARASGIPMRRGARSDRGAGGSGRSIPRTPAGMGRPPTLWEKLKDLLEE